MEAKDNAQLPASMEAAAAAIADRCASDPAWMAKLKDNPRQILQETIGRELPADLQIHLHQNDDDNWHVPIADAGGKLRDDDLRRVAGGEIAGTVIAVAGLTTLAVAGASAAAGGIASGVIAKKKKEKKK